MKKLILLFILLSSSFIIWAQDAENAAQKSLNNFDSKLYRSLCNNEGNVNYSAISIYSVLYSLQKGAAGSTKNQINAVIELEPSDQADAQLKEIITGTQNLTNSVWYNNKLTIKDSYNQFANNFDFIINPVNFKNAGQVKNEINTFIAQKTENLIENFLTEPLPKDTQLVLLNTLYFCQHWQSEFDERVTNKQDFYKTSASKNQVDMMHKTAYYQYYQTADFQVLELPYKDKRYSMIVILPSNYDYDFSKLNPVETVEKFNSAKASRRTQLSFPKFDLTTGYDLIPVLKSLGMTDSFNPSTADFSNTFNSPQSIYVDAVVHKVRIMVNEKETKAAAVTMASARATAAMPEPPVIFNADHPFCYVIRDKQTGINLFTGIVRQIE